MLVYFNHIFNSIDFRVKDVSVQSKAVVSLAHIGRYGGTKTKDGNLLVIIVILKNASDSFDCIKVLIFLQVVDVMKRVRLRRMSVRKSKVNRYGQSDFATTENVLEEGIPRLNIELSEGHAATLFRSTFIVVYLVFFLTFL